MNETTMSKSYHKNPLLAIALLTAVLAGCAKEGKTAKNEEAKRFLDAWITVHHPGVQPSGLGIYVIDDQPGDGASLTDQDLYVFIERTVTDLDGTVTATTSRKMAEQLGDVSEANYYGPVALVRDKGYTETGYLEMLRGMRLGGTRTAVIPGWLNVVKDHNSAEEYLKKESGDDVICTLRLVDKCSDILAWEIDSLERFAARWMGGVDSTYNGYYYKELQAPTSTDDIPNDSTFYINYTGRLLNGKVFDTTIEDTAKVHGIYSRSKTDGPVQVVKNEDFKSITVGANTSTSTSATASTVVDGFAYCLSQLKRYEKGRCAFCSDYGYGYSGKGAGITAFTPLCFDIELVDEP